MQISNNRLHLPHFSFDNSKELKLVYVIRVVRALITSVALFFVPLFLFQLAPQLNIGFIGHLSMFQQGIALISLYYLIENLTASLSIIETGKIISKIGHGRTFIFSQALFLLSLLLLRASVSYPPLVFLSAIIYGLERGCFWNSYQDLMVKNTHKTKTGQDLGLIQFFINFMMMISPAIGGIIISIFGYESLFLYASAILLVGIISALKMKSKPLNNSPSWSEFLKWTRERAFLQLSLAVGGKYFHEAGMFIWPLYVFILLGSADKVGYLHTFSLFLAMILSFFIGYQVDHAKTRKPFILSGIIMSALWFFRINIFNVWGIAISDVLNKIFQNYHGIFFDRKLFNRARGDKTFSYFVYHEMILGVSAMTFWLFFGAIFIAFELGWIGLFILCGMGALISLLIKEHQS